MIDRTPIVPERQRHIRDGSFGFIPHRFLRDGFLATLTSDQLALYLFLVLAADRKGISFYAYDRICSVLELTLDEYIAARNTLIDKDLVAFDGRRFQVLSLPSQPVQTPSKPLTTEADREEHDPATIRHLILGSLGITDSDQ
jgi:hypothetical protein